MYPIPDKQFAVIPHFIETNKSVDNENVEDRFVFIGRFSKEKQLDHLLKAYIEFLKVVIRQNWHYMAEMKITKSYDARHYRCKSIK